MIDKIKHIFIEETFNNLQEIKDELNSNNLIQITEQTVERVYRTMHTIKGTAPMFGYNHLTEITHAVEKVFKDLYDSKIELSNLIIDKTKDVVSLIEEVLNTENDQLTSSEKDNQTLIHFFNNIDRLNVRTND